MRLQLTRAASAVASAAALLCVAAPARAEWRHALDTMIYLDDDHVQVVSPRAQTTVTLDESGSEVSAAVTVDAVTAASVDVISQATSRFSETRVQLDVGGKRAFGDWLPEASLSLSLEGDYQSYGLGVGGERRLAGGDTVLALIYSSLYDRVGRADSRDWRGLWTHTVEGSLGQNLDARTTLRLTLTLVGQAGALEKPYRHVALFDEAGVAAAAAAGLPLDLTTADRFRLDAKPPEAVPDRRLRGAIGARLRRWLPSLDAAVYGDLRLYRDSWGLGAGTLELGAALPSGERWRFGLSLRAHLQGSATFWRRVYVVDDATSIPEYRTMDRELSAQRSFTTSGRAEWLLGDGAWSLYADTSVMITHFDDFMYLERRTALLVMLGARITP